MAEPLIWYATPAAGASYRKHLLSAHTDGRPPGTRLALCGEGHRKWQPVEEFARPEVFEECVGCVRVDRSEFNDGDPEDGCLDSDEGDGDDR